MSFSGCRVITSGDVITSSMVLTTVIIGSTHDFNTEQRYDCEGFYIRIHISLNSICYHGDINIKNNK